jgi:hypothetical protein
MSQCRIARRIALSVQVNNRCTQAVSAQTWATKVLHLLLQPFPLGGRAARRRWLAEGEPVTAASEGIGGSLHRAGMRLCLEGAATRRLAWLPVSRTTPVTTPSLATNDEASEVAR